jgi:hypothetical protein
MDGPVEGQLYSAQPCQIRVHYSAYRNVGNINMSLFVIRSDGLTCCMLRTKLDGFELQMRPGSGVVSVALEPLQLVSGTYFAEAWFLNAADSMALTPQPGRSDWFSVKGVARSYEESSGVYEPIARWHHEHDDRQAFRAGHAEAPSLSSVQTTNPS